MGPIWELRVRLPMAKNLTVAVPAPTSCPKPRRATTVEMDQPNTGENAPPNEPMAVTSPPDSDTEMIDNADLTAERPRRQTNPELTKLSKTYGHIPGVKIFSTWSSRQDCSDAAVHRPTNAGICGNASDGVFSLVVSNVYEDKDEGDTIIYTGTGGKKKHSDNLKDLRPGANVPQTSNQSWAHYQNRWLMKSIEMRNPIRVVRSSKCVSEYAPVDGYRYDGLYRIVDHWTEMGKSGFEICRCRLVRLEGQPPIPMRTSS